MQERHVRLHHAAAPGDIQSPGRARGAREGDGEAQAAAAATAAAPARTRDPICPTRARIASEIDASCRPSSPRLRRTCPPVSPAVRQPVVDLLRRPGTDTAHSPAHPHIAYYTSCPRRHLCSPLLRRLRPPRSPFLSLFLSSCRAVFFVFPPAAVSRTSLYTYLLIAVDTAILIPRHRKGPCTSKDTRGARTTPHERVPRAWKACASPAGIEGD